MADSYIAVVPATVGGGNLLMQTYQSNVNGNVVQIEAIALVDPTGLNSVGVTAGGLNIYLPTITANAGANLNTAGINASLTNGGQKTQICDPINASNVAGITSGGLNVYLPTIQVNAGTNLNTSALALSASQTNGGQKTQIVDGSGSVIGSVSNSLNIGVNQISGSAVSTAAAGIQKVGITGATGTALDGTTAGIVDENVKNVGGSAVSTAASGVQKVGIVGGAGATLDGTVAAGTAPTNGVPILGQFKATAPAPTDTQTVATQLDQAGNQRIAYGAATSTLSLWNSGTVVNTTQNIYTNSGSSQATVFLQVSAGTFSAGAITYEVTYDGTNWVAINANAVLDPTDAGLATIVLPYTLVSATNKAFSIQNMGWIGLRIKLSTAITGTGTVTPVYSLMPEGPGRPVTVASGGVGNNVNINKVGGTSVSATAGVQDFNLKNVGGTAVSATTGLLDFNVKQIAGSAVATGSAGIQQVAIMGRSGTQIDIPLGIQGNAVNGLQVLAQHSRTPPGTDSTSVQNQLQGDIQGNLKVMPGFGFDIGFSVWNSGTAQNSTQAIWGYNLSGCSMMGAPQSIVQLVQSSGTFSAGAITFEVTYDSVNWVTIPADAVMDPTSTSLAQIALPYTLVTSTNKPFLIINRGWEGLRIKLSTAITGTGTVTITAGHLGATSYVHNDLDFVAGGAVATVATGVQKVGIVGSTGTAVDSVAGVVDVNPKKSDGATRASPKYFVQRLTSKTTTYVTNSNAYVSVVRVGVSNAGTGATININDQSGSGNITMFAPNFPGGNLALQNYLEAYTEPLKYTNGIQIVTGGTTFGDCNIAITYWQ